MSGSDRPGHPHLLLLRARATAPPTGCWGPPNNTRRSRRRSGAATGHRPRPARPCGHSAGDDATDARPFARVTKFMALVRLLLLQREPVRLHLLPYLVRLHRTSDHPSASVSLSQHRKQKWQKWCGCWANHGAKDHGGEGERGELELVAEEDRVDHQREQLTARHHHRKDHLRRPAQPTDLVSPRQEADKQMQKIGPSERFCARVRSWRSCSR